MPCGALPQRRNVGWKGLLDARSPIAVEEHFWTPELRELRRGFDVLSDPEHGRRLGDLSDLRIREMDDAGIAMQVISHVEPAAQNFDPPEAVRLTRAANDMLHRAVETHPTRFAALAALPTSDPVAAAAELERTVTQLGFKGAMIHGLTRSAFPTNGRSGRCSKPPIASMFRSISIRRHRTRQ